MDLHKQAFRVAVTALRQWPYEASGHLVMSGKIPISHPLSGAGRVLLKQRAIELLERLKGRPQGERLLLGRKEVAAGLVRPCIRCGLCDWMVDDEGLHPLEPCPLANGQRTTTVFIDVPSGELVCGVENADHLFPGGEEAAQTILEFDGTALRIHHIAQLWECLGIAKLRQPSTEDRHLYATAEEIILTGTKITRVNPVLILKEERPVFICGDRKVLFPRAVEANAEALIQTLRVEPGRYAVHLFHGAAIFGKKLSTGARIAGHITMSRVGPAQPIPPLAERHAQARAYLERHPWLRIK